ncbi:hypothetical protein ABEB36_004207 [Hypothenemus hampei]|uniref:RRM domain-containing protein n=1 Tax=Hypothenemus hampei TaxID=57062 RepID=A0ABD1F350_HYPHA
MSISDLLGLNSPRGLLNFGSSDPLCVCTPPASPDDLQGNFDEAMLSNSFTNNNYVNSSNCIKGLQRNISLGSVGSSPASPPYISRNFRSISLSDSCGSNSPALLEQQQSVLVRSLSRTDSTDPNFSSSLNNNHSEITDLLNSLSLNENISKNLLGSNCNYDLDLLNFQNLQAVHVLKYLQQPPALFNSVLPHLTNNNSIIPDKWNNNNTQCPSDVSENSHLDRAARFHRSAASVYDAVCTWSGVLPARTEKPVGCSSKVFLGGVPWDISEHSLIQAFKQFGPVKVEWPGKERQASQPKGYAYLIMESEKAVKVLLQACTSNYTNSGNFYFKIGSNRMKSKDVQVIPWYLSDSNYTKSASQKLDPGKTVFVGALHGMLNAQGLANIMNDLFDGVVYAGIDTDKYKYPIGSGRVTFNNSRSYMKAVAAAFIEIKTAKFTKKVQVDPYLEDSLCSLCGVQQGPYFCRDIMCFRYFCRSCWSYQHDPELRHHNPMSRSSKHNCPATNNTNNLFGNKPIKRFLGV